MSSIPEEKYTKEKILTTKFMHVRIFIFFVYKVMHLDVVSYMASFIVISSFKKFIFRRDKCTKLFSNNAETYVGADEEVSLKHTNESL